MGTVIPDGHFYGRVELAEHVAGLTLSETSYEPGLRVPAHSHESSLFWLVLKGVLEECTGADRRNCGPGTLLFHPGDEPHSHRFLGTSARCFNVQLGHEWLARVGDYGGHRLGGPVDLRRGKAPWLAMQLYREFRQADPASALAIEGLSLALVAELGRTTAPALRSRAIHWLRATRALLEERYLEPLRLTDIAAEVRVHPVHLSRAFRQHFGCTLTQYVRGLRIEYASRRLAATDDPLVSIALAAGFADQAHFSRRFKEHTGMTPRAYRALHGRR